VVGTSRLVVMDQAEALATALALRTTFSE
jgi:hypothetical protein